MTGEDKSKLEAIATVYEFAARLAANIIAEQDSTSKNDKIRRAERIMEIRKELCAPMEKRIPIKGMYSVDITKEELKTYKKCMKEMIKIANAFKAKSKGNVYVLENEEVLEENNDTGENNDRQSK